MADLYDILPKSSAVKVMRQSQVNRKMCPKSGSIVASTAYYVSFKTLSDMLVSRGCLLIRNRQGHSSG